MTSRPLTSYGVALVPLGSEIVQMNKADVNADVKIFLDHTLSYDPLFLGKSDVEKEEMESKLLEKVNGMYVLLY